MTSQKDEKKTKVKKKNARQIAADYERFNKTVDFDKLPALTPEYFFKLFGPVMAVLKLSPTSPRFVADWAEHILPQQEAARQQAKAGLLVHLPTQGRPRTVFPLIEEIVIPEDLLHSKDLLVTPAGSDVPKHMFPKKRKTKQKNEYGFHDFFYFSPLVVVAGPQIRITMHEKYKFNQKEKDVMKRLTTQYDKKLGVIIAANEKARKLAEASLSSPPGITIPNTSTNDDSDDSDDSDDEEERQRRKRKERHAQEKKKRKQQEESEAPAKNPKPVLAPVGSCAEQNIFFDEEPTAAFSHFHNYVRNRELYSFIISQMKEGARVDISSAV